MLGFMRKRLMLMSLPVLLLGAGGATLAITGTATGAQASGVSSSSLGTYTPTFVGPAATGCASGCSLLSGPITTSSTAGSTGSKTAAAAGSASSRGHAVPAPNLRRRVARSGLAAAAAIPSAPIPTVNCPGAGCDSISTSAGGAVGVKGLNAVDSATHTANIYKDVEPPDQGLCAGNGYVVETNNIGEILVYNTALKRQSSPISLDTVMGLTTKGWSSGGDPSCEYDWSNGGHWFFTEIVSTSSEPNGGAFTGCFAGNVPSSCYEGIAVSQGSSPFGPYHVYFLNADYNPQEPGYPYLLNDFAKISVTRDAFLLFYDEFPLNGSVLGVGGGYFNGAQQFAFDKTAMETGQPVFEKNGKPNRNFNVAMENMQQVTHPDGTCTKDNNYGLPGVSCWYSVIPAQPADSGQFDNSNGGSGFMLASLDTYGAGDNRFAVFDWTGLGALNSPNCTGCKGIRFGGQLFSGVESYSNQGQFAAQKSGPIPLGDQCGAAGLSTGNPPPASCPEGGLATNGDNVTQASQADGQLWATVTTQVNQVFSKKDSEVHQGVAYWVVDSNSFDSSGQFNLTDQGYASAAHEDLDMPAIAGEGTGGNGKAIMLFTLSGNGGPTHANHGGFYPSTAYGRVSTSSSGLMGSTINVADAGQSPQDGFSEYQGYPGQTRPRWGDYSEGIYLPGGSGRIYFANEYIQYPNCTGKAFNYNAIGTCGGTRDGQANWGTSVNYVVP